MEFPCGQVTVSAGVATYAPGMGSADVLIAAADRALYQAKESGRDRAVLATEEPPWELRAAPDQRPLDTDAKVRATVVVVDDAAVVVAALTRLLERMGNGTRSADGGREALALFEEGGTVADVLLTDVVMPDMNGLVLVDELMRRGHDVPVIYMSSFIQSEVTWSGISGDVAGFVQQPIEMEALGEAMRGALGLESTEARIS